MRSAGRSQARRVAASLLLSQADGASLMVALAVAAAAGLALVVVLPRAKPADGR
jgi:hypothetical protein